MNGSPKPRQAGQRRRVAGGAGETQGRGPGDADPREESTVAALPGPTLWAPQVLPPRAQHKFQGWMGVSPAEVQYRAFRNGSWPSEVQARPPGPPVQPPRPGQRAGGLGISTVCAALSRVQKHGRGVLGPHGHGIKRLYHHGVLPSLSEASGLQPGRVCVWEASKYLQQGPRVRSAFLIFCPFPPRVSWWVLLSGL